METSYPNSCFLTSDKNLDVKIGGHCDLDPIFSVFIDVKTIFDDYQTLGVLTTTPL